MSPFYVRRENSHRVPLLIDFELQKLTLKQTRFNWNLLLYCFFICMGFAFPHSQNWLFHLYAVSYPVISTTRLEIYFPFVRIPTSSTRANGSSWAPFLTHCPARRGMHLGLFLGWNVVQKSLPPVLLGLKIHIETVIFNFFSFTLWLLCSLASRNLGSDRVTSSISVWRHEPGMLLGFCSSSSCSLAAL